MAVKIAKKIKAQLWAVGAQYAWSKVGQIDVAFNVADNSPFSRRDPAGNVIKGPKMLERVKRHAGHDGNSGVCVKQHFD